MSDNRAPIDWVECLSCDQGMILVCCDDICQGAGECMHGDGEAVCHECGGSGEVPIYETTEGDNSAPQTHSEG